MNAVEKRWVGREGGCVCGALRYRLEAPPLAMLACHCTDCQTRSASAFGLSMFLLEASVRLLQGQPSVYESQQRDHLSRATACGHCHVRLWTTSEGRPGLINLKAGTLDDTSDLRPVGHVWVRSKQPWVQLPQGDLVFEEQPGADATGMLVEAWAKQQAALSDAG